jgi:flagellar biosynthesis regulator FlaF
MTIDERIEALTQSLELLASLHRDLEESSAKGFAELRDTMIRLANIVITHEDRLDRLEGK